MRMKINYAALKENPRGETTLFNYPPLKENPRGEDQGIKDEDRGTDEKESLSPDDLYEG
ncbi:hypothetical protein HFN76_28170 [Rhizobium laguerreae]|uniref:hypothetical protein n=1 Tax=Rhizobium laguerreae TaxID=1076926 RepID=UPI001C92329B|nr:hypothetical protein [Rhizobium laguerreae]MBY3516059.1 hypothetical protein [Rhizobium laguerreae]